VFKPVVDDGEVVSLIISSRDITAQRTRERELEVMQRRLEAILENTTAPMFMKSDEGRYIFVNREYRELFGWAERPSSGGSTTSCIRRR
jgi:PAS domain-containing protein